MAKIIRAQTQSKVGGTAGKQLNPGSTTAANLIGRTTQSAGNLIQSLGQEYFDAAHASFQNAEYSRAISEGTKQLNTLYNERLRQRTDDNGNPNYGTLVTEVNQFGAGVRDNILKGIFDPEVKQKFQLEFDRFVGNKVIMAQGEARRQHIDYARASLQESVTKLSEQAYEDDLSNMNHYAERIDEIIQGSLASGVISAQAAVKLREDTLQNLAVAKATRVIDQNPFQALEYLERPGEETGLTFENRRKLERQAQAAIKRAEADARRAAAEARRIQRQNMTLNSTELSLGILQGVTTEQHVEEALARGQISPTQRARLLKQVIRRDQGEAKKAESFEEVTQALLEGRPAYQSSPKAIGDHYTQVVNSLSEKGQAGQQKPISIQKKAGIAAQYKNPVKPIQKELTYSLLHGNTDDAEQAALSIEWLNERNPVVLQGMDKTAKAVAAKFQEIIDTSNVNSKEALRISKELVLDIDDDIKKQRGRDFGKVEDFNEENIDTFINDTFNPTTFSDVAATTVKGVSKTIISGVPLGSTSAERVSTQFTEALGLDLPKDVKIDDTTRNVIRDRLRDAYIRTGDPEAAKRLAKFEINSVIGETGFNGGEIMLLPPEKATAVETEVLMEDLQETIATPFGIPVDRLRVRTNEVTRNSKVPIWQVHFINAAGVEQVLTNDEGEPILWTPDIQKVYMQRVEEEEIELRDKQTGAVNSATQQVSEQEFRDRRSGL